MRRPMALTDSTFRPEQWGSAWWVRETWWELNRDGDKVDEWERYGPFRERATAEAEALRMTEQATCGSTPS